MPVEGSVKFEAELRKLHPETDVLLTLLPGEHGFDAAARLDAPWLKEGLEFVGKHWPGGAEKSSL